MCGICGVVNSGAEPGAIRSVVEEMTADLERRGPDDEGLWQDPGTGTALGFRRLSIIDPSPAGAQPMASDDGEDVLVFNGEVYNHGDLRTELDRAGVRFRSRSDTEVLLQALRHWGLDATLPRLRGMFAFAWYRPSEGRLVLARDHVGIKPLYWARRPGGQGVAFSSRYDSLFRTGWLDLDDVDPAVVGDYLHFRRVPAPAALHRGAAQVAPGHYLVIGPAGVEREVQWWRLPEVEADLRGTDAVEATAESLERSVRRHLVSDVPLGVFLSAGIDSPLVAGTANRLAGERLRSFTVAVPSWAHDEGPGARRLADALGLDHREHVMEALGADEVNDLVAAVHEPLNDLSLLPTLAVSRFARTEVTVALSGDGGDELFFGYLRPWSVDAHRALWRLPRRARRVPLALLRRTGRLRSGATEHQGPGDYYRAMHRSGSTEALARLAPGLPVVEPDGFAHDGDLDRRALAAFGRAVDIRVQLNRILAKVDTASMHHGLEVRVPLLDPDVITTSLRIDPAWTLGQDHTKPVLRDLLDRLAPPGSGLDDKRGFTVPLEDWLRGPLAPLVEDTLAPDDLWPAGALDPTAARRLWDEHRTGRRQHTILLWGVLVLQWWASRMATTMPTAGPRC